MSVIGWFVFFSLVYLIVLLSIMSVVINDLILSTTQKVWVISIMLFVPVLGPLVAYQYTKWPYRENSRSSNTKHRNSPSSENIVTDGSSSSHNIGCSGSSDGGGGAD